MLHRGLLVMFAAVGGCATASGSHVAGGEPDARSAPSTPDARPSPPGTPDAATADPPDAATGSPDAASVSGCAQAGFSGALATWSFAGATGTQASTASSTTASGVTAGAVTRAASLTPMSGAGSINSSNWATTAQVSAGAYYTFSITPPPGCTLDVTGLAIDAKSSTSGPKSAAAATSADSFAQTTSLSTTAASTPAVTATTSGAALEIRVYGYAATGSGGTMRLQNTLTVNGALH